MDLNTISTFEMNGVEEDTRRFLAVDSEILLPVYRRALVPAVPVRCFFPGCGATLGRAPLLRFTDKERARLFAHSRFYISEKLLACRSHGYMLNTLQAGMVPLLETWPWCGFTYRDYHEVTELLILHGGGT